MLWTELSNEAKSVIEWVEDPFTGKRTTLKIKVGESFEPETIYGMKPTKVLITDNVYQEILRFVTEDKELECEQSTDSLIFKTRDVKS